MNFELAEQTSGENALSSEHEFQEWLRRNMTSDVALQILEECLIEENSSYAALNFEQALRELQQKDGGRYYLLKALLEAYATKEGQVLLDPKMVNASYKERKRQLDLLKSMGRFRRFVYRLSQAVVGLLNEKSETEAIQEAIQITGEVKIAKDELATLEAKKAQTAYDTNQLLFTASDKANKILSDANEKAFQSSQELLKESRASIERERGKMYEVFSLAYDKHISQSFTTAVAMRKQLEHEIESQRHDEMLVVQEEKKRVERKDKFERFMTKENTRQIQDEYLKSKGEK